MSERADFRSERADFRSERADFRSERPCGGHLEIPPCVLQDIGLWGRCPAPTQLLQLITPSRASGTADHVRSLDD